MPKWFCRHEQPGMTGNLQVTAPMGSLVLLSDAEG